MRIGIRALTVACSAVMAVSAQTPSKLTESVERFLRGYDAANAAKDTRYIAAFHDLNGDRIPEAIVYLLSAERCGSGGCSMLILTPDAHSWKLVTRTTITQLPVGFLPTSSHGRNDLSVRVEGGGVQPGYFARLTFDGRTYPHNPSAPPAKPISDKSLGQVLIAADDKTVDLYSTIRPSFDCAAAKTPTEKLICRDEHLASLDQALAAAWNTALAHSPGDRATRLRSEQSSWYRAYSAACNTLASDSQRSVCITEKLTIRTRELRSRLP